MKKPSCFPSKRCSRAEPKSIATTSTRGDPKIHALVGPVDVGRGSAAWNGQEGTARVYCLPKVPTLLHLYTMHEAAPSDVIRIVKKMMSQDIPEILLWQFVICHEIWPEAFAVARVQRAPSDPELAPDLKTSQSESLSLGVLGLVALGAKSPNNGGSAS
jgi:hypothetical protein